MSEHITHQNEGLTSAVENENAVTSEIVLHLFRHDKKGKAMEGETDQQVRLTPDGRAHAIEYANPDANLAQSVAFGSPRDRAQETAGLHMAGAHENITGDETLDELRVKLDNEFKLGKAHKIGADPRLDFTSIHGSVVGDGCDEAYAKGVTLEWMVKDSDRLAIENNDEENSTYNRSAAQIANIILKYIKVSENWNKLVANGQYEDNKLERFLSSHQTVPESFLAKVVELTKGEDERDRLVDALDKNGFKFSEGYDIRITRNANDKPTLHLTFHRDNEDKPDDDRLRRFDFDEDVPIELVERIAEGS